MMLCVDGEGLCLMGSMKEMRFGMRDDFRVMKVNSGEVASCEEGVTVMEDAWA